LQGYTNFFDNFAARVKDWSGILLLFSKRYSGKPDASR